MDNLERQIPELLNKNFLRKRKISFDTRIYHDLWLFGDAAEDFLFDFRDTFDVGFKDFEFQEYFLNEGMPPSYIWKGVKRIFGFKEDFSKIPITVSHLAEIARKKKWFDPALF